MKQSTLTVVNSVSFLFGKRLLPLLVEPGSRSSRAYMYIVVFVLVLSITSEHAAASVIFCSACLDFEMVFVFCYYITQPNQSIKTYI